MKPTDVAASINTLVLANFTDTTGNTTSDPTITGTVANDDGVSGIRVEIYQGTTLLGTTQTDDSGAFHFTPSGLTNGNVTLSGRACEWSPITREYQYSDFETVTFSLSDLVMTSPAVQEFTVADMTGTGNTTANPYLTGKLVADDGNISRVKVEFDYHGDGVVDGHTYSESDGTFRYLPSLTPGSYTIHARSSILNTHTNQWVSGDWTSCPLTVVTLSTNWIPEIDTVTTVTGTANDHGVMVTDLPAIVGQITSEGGYANLTVEYDTDGDHVSNHTEAPDQWGCFAWKDTTLSSPTSSGQMLTWNVRAVYTDPTTQTTTVGNWTSYSYIYQDRTVEATLDYATIVRNTNVDNNSVYKITGSISFGNHGVQTHVELDYRGTEVADGIAVPNSDGMFTFYVTPENPTIRIRVVETLADGTRHYPTQEWHTLSLTPKPYTPGMSPSGTSEDVRLTLVTWDEYLATGVVLRMDGTLGLGQIYSSYRVSVDFDSDDTTDIQLIPDEQGRITLSMIEVAIRSGCKKELPEGLILCPARLTLSGSTTVIAETLMPYIRRGELDDTAYTLCQEQLETFHDTVETYHDALRETMDASTENTGIEIQYTQEPYCEEELTSTNDRSPAGISTADRDRIQNAIMPDIPTPQFTSELPDLVSDPAYQDAVDAVYHTYLSSVNTVKEVFRNAYDIIADTYEKSVGDAWESYAKTYDRLLKASAKIEAESVYTTKEWAEMQTAQQNQLQKLSEERTVKNGQVAAYYSSASQVNTNAMNTAMATCCDSNCNGNTHSVACQESRILVQQEYTLLHTDILYESELRYAEVNAWYTLERFNVIADSVSKMISFRTHFKKDKADRLLTINEQMASAGTTYQFAAAELLKTSLTAIATQTQTYRNSMVSTWSTAVSDTYAVAANVLNTWAQTSGTDANWASYVLNIAGNADTEANSVISAYTTQSSADATAEKNATVAQANALYVANVAIATRNESDAKSAAQKQTLLRKDHLTVMEAYETEVVRLRSQTASEQTSTWRSAVATLLSTDKTYHKQILGYNNSCTNEIRAIQKSYDRGDLSYAQYTEQTNAVYVTYGRLSDTASVRQEQAALRSILAYHTAIQRCQQTFSTAAVGVYETYENDLANNLGGYWKGMISIASGASSSYANTVGTYTNSVNSAANAYQTATLSAAQTAESSSLTAAQTRANADTTDETSWLSSVMTAFSTTVASAYNGISDAFVETLCEANWSDLQSYFSTELSGSSTLIGNLISGAVSQTTTALSSGVSLVENLLSGVASWISGVNSATSTAETSANSASVRLSNLEIDARGVL